MRRKIQLKLVIPVLEGRAYKLSAAGGEAHVCFFWAHILAD